MPTSAQRGDGLLLDTHIWLWWLTGHEQLAGAGCRSPIERAEVGGRLAISAITLWEALLLHDVGRLDLGPEPRRWLAEARQRFPVTVLPIGEREAVESRLLPGELHRDPADRFIVATARIHRRVLVTADARLLAYAAAGHLAAMDIAGARIGPSEPAVASSRARKTLKA